MNLVEPIRMAFNSLWANKLRSSLTLLGVIIGVFTIIGMQSVIVGFQKNVHKELSALGANVFQVQKYPSVNMGGHDRHKYRNRKDITWENGKAIQEYATHVAAVGIENWEFGAVVKYGDKRTSPSVRVAGGTPEFAISNGYFVERGRFLTDSDVLHNRNVVVVGVDIIEELLPNVDPLGKEIKVAGKPFRIIGVFQEMGSRFGNSRDNRLVIPLSTWESLYGTNRSVNLTIRAKSADEFQQAMDEVNSILRTVRKVPLGEPNDFEIWSSESQTAQFDNMTRMVRFAAIGIASISLLVAGIGIMNIMMVTVTERTREIGIRKAIGAQRGDILRQFLIESIILSVIGGLIGIVIGIGVAQVLSKVTPLPSAVPLWTIMLALVFCSIIGLFFGLYPAAKAAKMDPIESLRYE
ncbi:MAG: Macrolide export ATP-binding/permease protein MacB [Candidatus Marinimicrobia bacterium]|nr:Macrolide export ATP-binding/permease protein MacB [Candidatus Neomarinimicrobiota bacterium]